MKCNSKISNTCSEAVFAQCTNYETNLPSWSTIGECPNLEVTTKELYEQITQLRENTDVSELGELCISYTEGKKVKDVLLEQELKICELQNQVQVLQTTDFWTRPILNSGLDLLCLVPDPCDESIITVKDLFQSIINKICD